MQTQEEVMMMIKGKRSKRRYNPSTTTSSSNTTDLVLTSDFVSGTTSDHDQDEQDMANCLILLAKGRGDHHHKPSDHQNEIISFQCKTCNKSFPSFQALGGHRASHKNKPPIATIIRDTSPKQIQGDDDDSTILSLQITSRVSSEKKASRVHECSICGAEFNSGQALGGHMRRHRGGTATENKRRRNDLLSLDLNLPAPSEDHHDLLESKFPFGPTKEQVIVFSSTSSLVDCHY